MLDSDLERSAAAIARQWLDDADAVGHWGNDGDDHGGGDDEEDVDSNGGGGDGGRRLGAGLARGLSGLGGLVGGVVGGAVRSAWAEAPPPKLYNAATPTKQPGTQASPPLRLHNPEAPPGLR